MKKFLVIGGVLTMIVIMAWIAIAVYDASINIEVNPNSEQHMTRIQPTFDIEVIENVKERINILQVSPKILRALENSPEPSAEDIEDLDEELSSGEESD